MNFKQALKHMVEDGYKMKLPFWGGYWTWNDEKHTIMMHTKFGFDMDIRETQGVYATLKNIMSDEWQIADESNCPQLGGKTIFSFSDAISYLKRGLKVARKGWNGKGIYLELQVPDEHSKMTLPYIYIVTSNLITDNPHAPKGVVPWLASQTDMLADDWVLVE